ncbi:alpha/beta hydrolase [Xanthomonas bundabergensis]|uniref:alpha/beta hydrolase n=1 Tax=Xanthomonas bundabergensis TaxID=3160842 RepID=UPI003517C820
MSRIQRLCLVLIAASLTIGCSTLRNIVYTQEERRTEQSAFFMDRRGDLYPPGDVYVSKWGVWGRKFKEASLEAHFRRQARRQSSDWQKLLRITEVKPTGNFDSDWDLVQRALVRRAADQFNHEGASDVLLVVHGFNNNFEKANKWLDPFQDYIQQARPKTHVVRMYWDGLSNRTGIGIWGEAQYNGPHVGQSLRRILNQLDPNTKLRIFTHSSGAYVVVNALGNGGASFQDFSDKSWSKQIRERAGQTEGEYAIPSRIADLRVAMLVPAQPTIAFDRFTQNKQAGSGLVGVIPKRLVLGTSAQDSATTKHFVGCEQFGVTCMATQPKSACSEVRTALERPGQPSPVVVVDFPKPSNGNRHQHGVTAYMEDTQEWGELIRQLFGPAAGEEAPLQVGSVPICS